MTNPVALLALATLLIAAVACDTRRMRIPNLVVALGLAAGCGLGAVDGGAAGIGRALLGAVTGFACLLPFYVRNGMGAGDVKLMAAVGSFFGPIATVFAAACTLMAGACLALGVLTERRAAIRAAAGGAAGMAPAHMLGKTRFPYALAIAIGAVLAIAARHFRIIPGLAP